MKSNHHATAVYRAANLINCTNLYAGTDDARNELVRDLEKAAKDLVKFEILKEKVADLFGLEDHDE